MTWNVETSEQPPEKVPSPSEVRAQIESVIREIVPTRNMTVAPPVNRLDLVHAYFNSAAITFTDPNTTQTTTIADVTVSSPGGNVLLELGGQATMSFTSSTLFGVPAGFVSLTLQLRILDPITPSSMAGLLAQTTVLLAPGHTNTAILEVPMLVRRDTRGVSGSNVILPAGTTKLRFSVTKVGTVVSSTGTVQVAQPYFIIHSLSEDLAVTKDTVGQTIA